MRGTGSNFLGPSDSSSFVRKWQIKVHFQIMLRSFGDCCIVYERNQQMVFVFPIGRIPRLTSVIWKEFDEDSGYSFLFGDTYFSDGPSEGKAQEKFQYIFGCAGSDEPGWTFTQWPLSRWQSFFRKLGGSETVVGSPFWGVWMPRVWATQLSWAT